MNITIQVPDLTDQEALDILVHAAASAPASQEDHLRRIAAATHLRRRLVPAPVVRDPARPTIPTPPGGGQ